ncbi:MAG: class I SAM-dependent methyltransferase [Culicoidibacterales bacterium]
MALYRPIPFVHMLLKKHLTPASYVIDATCGNGHDSLFMASLLGYRGRLFGFDIQQRALDQTRIKLAGSLPRFELFCLSHDNMYEQLEPFLGKIDLVVFNLGFYPNHPHEITTMIKSTYSAILQAICLLKRKGLLIVVAYPGHENGAIESQMLSQLFTKADPNKYFITKYQQTNGFSPTPIVYTIEQK